MQMMFWAQAGPRQINLPGWPHWGKHDLCYFDIFWQFIFFKSFALGCLSIVLGASEISVILSRVPYVSCACFARLVHLLFFGLGAGAVARWGVATPWTPKREPLDAGMGDYNYLFKCHGVESRMTWRWQSGCAKIISVGKLQNFQWEAQDPKMELLYHIQPYFGSPQK